MGPVANTFTYKKNATGQEIQEDPYMHIALKRSGSHALLNTHAVRYDKTYGTGDEEGKIIHDDSQILN